MKNLLLLLFVVSFSANSIAADIAIDGAPIQRNFEVCNNIECSDYLASKFYMDKHFLSGSHVYGESFYLEWYSMKLAQEKFT